MIPLILYAITVLASVFSLGAVVLLFVKYRSKLLQNMALFLLSLTLISCGFFTSRWNLVVAETALPQADFLLWFVFFPGVH